ncbi:Metallo-dependent phosphatase-like [Lasallia pustulata]|uniref:Metallo-dependent phosphatase-like n=1 Tax=Lasallia pustulata TaxID=136370 RepID=A0A1W5D3U1_9LECA|nr:Metallo-dependent phosphatase-like [Lasallia pustulata]
MDARYEHGSSQYAPAPSSSRRESARMDPNYPYSDEGPSPQTYGASQLPSSDTRKEDYDTARTTSRTRRGSGKVAVDNGEQQFSLPTAPDVPRNIPPASYRDPYVNDALPPFVHTTPKSFAARARASPANLDPPPATEDTQLGLQNTRPTRRTSVSRPSGIIYPQVKPPVQAQFASDPRQPTSPEHSSNVTSLRQDTITDPTFTHQSKSQADSRRPVSAKAPLAASHTRRLSTTAAEQRKAWAEDRSPLQTLEVKLNDISKISKEEKRARVEQAEQLLRESKAVNGYGRASQEPTTAVKRTSSKRVSTAEVNDKSNGDHSRRSYQAVESLPPRPTGDRPRQVATEHTIVDDSDTLLPRRQKDTSELLQYQGRARDLSSTEPDRPASQDWASQGPQRPTRVINSRKAEARGVRFQTQEYPDESYSDQWGAAGPNMRSSDTTGDHTKQANKEIGSAARRRGNAGSIQNELGQREGPVVEKSSKVSKEQLDLYASRLEPSVPNDSAALYGGAPDPLPLEAVRSHGPAHNYEIPPQSASGIEAGHLVGFGSGQQVSLETSTGRNHHLTDIFRHGHKTAFASNAEHHTQPKNLDEWRRGGVARLTASDLATDHDAPTKNRAWWEADRSGHQRRTSWSGQDSVGKSQASGGGYEDEYAATPTSFNPRLYLKCGPLLRYTGTKRVRVQTPRSRGGNVITERETWRGSVMIVTVDADSSYDPGPILRLFPQSMNLLPPPPQQVDGESGEGLPSEYVDPVAGLPKLSRTGNTVYVKPVEDLEEGVDLSPLEDDDGLFEETRTAAVPTAYGKGENPPPPGRSTVRGKTGAKGGRGQEVRGVRLHAERGVTFWRFNLEVELGEQQARIAYSINQAASVGFWVPAKGQTMNIMFHSCNGFSLSVNPSNFCGPDPLWRDVLNTHQTRPFHVMIGGGDQIYNDVVTKQSPLFQEWLGIKNPIHKQETSFSPQLLEELETVYLERYSMWFSQGFFGMANSQIPMVNVWDDHDIIDGFGSYPHHFMSTPVFSGLGNVAFKYYMLFQHQSVPDEGQAEEPSWLLGAAPGPYINQLSRSLFMFLGKHVAFLGLDCRTERMRDEILSEASYGLVFDRCRREIVEGDTRHLIVLLGVPIAYPRLVWLENLLTSKVMDPVKAVGRIGVLGNLLNKFDGGVEILDDLDDHWTASHHKAERKWFIEELQDLAAEKSVRITILGGDVHLAAVGQFYSHPKLKVPKDRDHRYMPNIISSAIVNTPPPEMMGDILNKRNKVHHFDPETDEDMIPMFTHDVDGKPRNNKRLLPRRNWCQIREYHPGSTPPPTPPTPDGEMALEDSPAPPKRLQRTLSLTRNDIKPGNLLRRLSQRGPPNSNDVPVSNEHRTPTAVSPINRGSTDGYFPPQTVPISGVNRGPPFIPTRPSEFHRRPTNFSDRAAKKGGADLDNDQNGHVNLEGGLDIVINCEVNQRDPAGITVPYRLLVPALWYDGDGDANMENLRKSSWLKRGLSMVGGVSRRNTLAGRQGQGMWGGSESESGSDSRSDEEESGQSEAAFRNKGNGYERPPIGGRVMSGPATIGHRQGANEGPTTTMGQGRNAGDLPGRYQQESEYEQRPLEKQSMGMEQAGKPLQQQMGHEQRSQSFSTEPGRGYSGIKAYKEKGKGWRKFF